MHTTYQVVPIDVAIGHESSTMDAPAVEHTVTFAVRPPNHDEVHAFNKGVDKSARFDVGPDCNSCLVHLPPGACK
jgi:hypothetical protein